MNPRLAAILGALTADAASLGLHWLYDPQRLRDIALEGPITFLDPDPARYAGVKGYFAHGGKGAGALSGYGAALALLARHLAERGGRFQRQDYQQDYLRYFGPGGAYVGYVDHPTRQAVATLARCEKPEAFPAVSGADDDQLPALECVVPLVAAHQGERADLLARVQEALAVTQDHPVARDAARIAAQALADVLDGRPLDLALADAAEGAGEVLKPLLLEALAMPELDAQGAAARFGMPCRLHQGLPVLFHIARRASGYREAVEANILAGGDSCGRSLLLGALAAAREPAGIPVSWLARVEGMAELAALAEELTE